MKFKKAVSSVLIDFEQIQQILNRNNIAHINLSEPEERIKEFYENHQHENIFIITTYSVIPSEKSIIVATAKSRADLLRLLKNQEARIIEIDSFEEIIGWRDAII